MILFFTLVFIDTITLWICLPLTVGAGGDIDEQPEISREGKGYDRAA
jgi:hypothetical protein